SLKGVTYPWVWQTPEGGLQINYRQHQRQNNRWGRMNFWLADYDAETGTWKHRELPWVAGTVPRVFMDRNDNAYLIFGATKGPDIPMKMHSLDYNCTIAAASAKSNWTDWRVVHVEDGTFFSDVLGDPYRWKQEGVLSVILQDSPKEIAAPSALRILDSSVGTD
ncbi:MAG: hypothetical protein GWO24_36055, partial [Akkermansiaceae bacterium]|nr:hypothetical protein [Akkermansiaceae bacterium]